MPVVHMLVGHTLVAVVDHTQAVGSPGSGLAAALAEGIPQIAVHQAAAQVEEIESVGGCPGSRCLRYQSHMPGRHIFFPSCPAQVPLPAPAEAHHHNPLAALAVQASLPVGQPYCVKKVAFVAASKIVSGGYHSVIEASRTRRLGVIVEGSSGGGDNDAGLLGIVKTKAFRPIRDAHALC